MMAFARRPSVEEPARGETRRQRSRGGKHAVEFLQLGQRRERIGLLFRLSCKDIHADVLTRLTYPGGRSMRCISTSTYAYSKQRIRSRTGRKARNINRSSHSALQKPDMSGTQITERIAAGAQGGERRKRNRAVSRKDDVGMPVL